MGFEEWYHEKKVKPKQDWARVSQQAKQKKLDNKKSKRDILREESIKSLGGEPIEVQYGVPLEEALRDSRKELEWDLKYPNRAKNKGLDKQPRIPRAFGEERNELQYRRDLFQGAKARAKAQDLPFNLEMDDIEIPTLCPVLGIEMQWGNSLTNFTPTLDKIVPKEGYVKGNVKVISAKANRLKNNATLEELEKIVAYIKQNL